jgi:hypothetical protein
MGEEFKKFEELQEFKEGGRTPSMPRETPDRPSTLN